MRKFVLNALLLSSVISVGHAQAQVAGSTSSTASRPVKLSPAPVARSNWAVARLGDQVFTFFGLGVGKASSDIARDVHALDLKSGQWRKVGDIPVEHGRLASAALTVAGEVYVLGGYTVSPAGVEVSTPEVLRFAPDTGRFVTETLMPIPVDDTVAMPWRDRWIVLVSGWHDTANVSDVQIYDTKTKQWSTGTPWPGKPVFGHAGGLVKDAMIICDGVTAEKKADGKNLFAITNECWEGSLDAGQIGKISWRQLPAHPGAPLYRAGAVGASSDKVARVVFAGGSSRPYNYNGIGYDGLPSEPSAAVFSFQPERGTWEAHAPLPEAGMDFRGLVALDGAYGLFGGMRSKQQVSGDVIRFSLRPGAGLR
jgi:N-acetylneuraminic acid mutarotase